MAPYYAVQDLLWIHNMKLTCRVQDHTHLHEMDDNGQCGVRLNNYLCHHQVQIWPGKHSVNSWGKNGSWAEIAD